MNAKPDFDLRNCRIFVFVRASVDDTREWVSHVGSSEGIDITIRVIADEDGESLGRVRHVCVFFPFFVCVLHGLT